MTTLPAGRAAAEALAPGASDRAARGVWAGEALVDGGDGELAVPVVQPVTIASAVTVAASDARNQV
ncbi:MAG: hypothetical protein M3253_02475 [Chloroflexota bacterium]|nr:hypothetical protein [Chloroflexota bacterium]